MPKRPLKAKDLIKLLKKYGVVQMPRKRGKGSERILLKPDSPGSPKGPQIPIKYHGSSTEIYIPVILSILRRFDIDPSDFWD